MKGQAVCMVHGGKATQAIAKAQAAMELAEMRLRGLTMPAVNARCFRHQVLVKRA